MGKRMAFTYNPLWKQLVDKGMTKEELREEIKTSAATIAKMGKGGYVSLEVIDRICTKLECQIEDVVQYVPGEQIEE
jgi:putative transcriptional regulator